MKHPAVSVILVRLFVFVLLGLQSISARADENTCPKTAQQFWDTFRISILEKNMTAITNATHFPFVVFSGELDFDRKKKTINRKEFIRIFPALLKIDPGESPSAPTMESLIKTTTLLAPVSCISSGTQFGVGGWVFHLTSEGWRFTTVYVGDEFMVKK